MVKLDMTPSEEHLYVKLMTKKILKDAPQGLTSKQVLEKAHKLGLTLTPDNISKIQKEGHAAGYYAPLPWLVKDGVATKSNIATVCASSFFDNAEDMDAQLFGSLLGAEAPIHIDGQGILESQGKAAELGTKVGKVLASVKAGLPPDKGHPCSSFRN